MFTHDGLGIPTMVHGDDYVSSGSAAALDWLQQELETKYQTNTRLRKPTCESDSTEVKVLNRIIRCTEFGLELEADPRHCELIIEETLDSKAKGLSTPGTDEPEKDEEEKEELTGDEVRAFRSAAARCNYLSQGRPEIMYATKEVCREMSSATKGSWRILQRIAQFFVE